MKIFKHLLIKDGKINPSGHAGNHIDITPI